jgi:hypothetical protein
MRSRNWLCRPGRLEAILIGNMAAALHGAPVSTIDIDFFFRKTARNMQKLKRVATALDAVILRPYYTVSALFRLHRERDGLRVNFKWHIDAFDSWEDVRGRAIVFEIGGQKLLVAAPMDVIIRDERVAENVGPESAAPKRKSERALTELIRYRLSLPPEKRLNCLRRKIGLRATCL